jgi:hypothetical protein
VKEKDQRPASALPVPNAPQGHDLPEVPQATEVAFVLK